MWQLFGIRADRSQQLVATFDSEAQLSAYVNWAILQQHPDGTFLFEQKTPLTGYTTFESSPLATSETLDDIPHNPSPSML